MEKKLNDKWIGIEEAADYLGVKPVTIRGWIRNKKVFQHIRLGNNGSLSVPN